MAGGNRGAFDDCGGVKLWRCGDSALGEVDDAGRDDFKMVGTLADAVRCTLAHGGKIFHRCREKAAVAAFAVNARAGRENGGQTSRFRDSASLAREGQSDTILVAAVAHAGDSMRQGDTCAGPSRFEKLAGRQALFGVAPGSVPFRATKIDMRMGIKEWRQRKAAGQFDRLGGTNKVGGRGLPANIEEPALIEDQVAGGGDAAVGCVQHAVDMQPDRLLRRVSIKGNIHEGQSSMSASSWR